MEDYEKRLREKTIDVIERYEFVREQRLARLNDRTQKYLDRGDCEIIISFYKMSIETRILLELHLGEFGSSFSEKERRELELVKEGLENDIQTLDSILASYLAHK